MRGAAAWVMERWSKGRSCGWVARLSQATMPVFFFFLMIRRPPISTPFPSPPLSRSSRQAEALIALVEPVLFEQRAPQHEASVADLVHPVGARDRGAAVAEPLERMSRVLFGLDR